jgi:DNA adenine methylase
MTRAQPFLKWAGGKGQLLEQYRAFFPADPPRRYLEPFVGSGAVFFYLRDLWAEWWDSPESTPGAPRGAARGAPSYHLSDANEELITCYLAVRDDVDGLIARLERHRARHSPAHYAAVRAWDRTPPDGYTPTDRAARLIYLNKTCYNGLWRVNRRGYFNVPMGRYAHPAILNADRLRAASAALQGVEIAVRGFEAVAEGAGPGDFVYFDPPYVPLSATASFTSYSADSFGPEEQRRLAQTFAALDRQGCRVMLSNSDTDFVRELYRGFRIETVTARRVINSKAGRRGAISEVVVVNY